jgi:alpha-beta hydrolase superfamily lysophospholipase
MEGEMSAASDTPRLRLPWWLAVVLGLACAAVGVVLIFRPFTSLSVLILLVAAGLIATGIATLAAARRSASRLLPKLAGVAWIAAGVLVLAWPDITTRGLAVVVGVTLIVGGLLDVVAGLRGTTDERLAAVISGLASMIFGVLALTWPDVTVLVVAIVFGARLVLFGLRLAWTAFRDRDGVAAAVADRPPGRLRRVGHALVAVLVLVIALALAGVSWRINEAEPVVDAFYDTPDDVPAEPGALLRSEPFTREIPDGARAWRILYTTTVADGVPAVASGIVVVPDRAAGEPPPVIAWAHGTTGVARRCAPSVLPNPWTAGAFFSLDRVVDEGWALVATDYVGLGSEGEHPYLVGEPAGRSVLDAVRAARQLDGVEVSDQTVVWGHSQGGGAALWTGVLAPSYAPDANVIGVAALAPASDLVALMDNLPDVTGGSIFAAYAVRGYASFYDDVAVGDYVRPTARTTFEEIAGRCLNAAALVSVLSAVTVGMDIFTGDVTSGPLARRLGENVPRAAIEAPLLLGQGEADSLVVPEMQDAYVAARCADGFAVDYRTYAGLDHVPLVEPDSPLIPELIDWTHQRLDGAEPSSTCP